MLFLVALSVWAVLVTAPSTSTNSLKSSSYVVNFDDISTVPVQVGVAITPISVPYNDLQWGVLAARANGLSILRSRSGQNTAANSMLDGTVKDGGRPFITTDYQGSAAKYFQLIRAYIGCAVTTEANIGVPQACALKFTGTQYPSGKVVTKTCGYAGSALSPALALCQFGSDFASVRRADIEVIKSATTTTITVLYLDDVSVKVFKTA